MPDVKFKCPKCGQSLEAPPDMAGQVAECPTCKTSMRIPSPTKPSPRPPPRPAPPRSAPRSNRLPLYITIGIVVLVAGILGATAWRRSRTASEVTKTISPQTGTIRTPAATAPESRSTSRVKAKVKGGAWVTKKAGNSEVLRGLKIYLVRASANNGQYLKILTSRLASEQESLASAKRSAEHWAGSVQRNPDNEYILASKNKADAMLKLVELVAQGRQRDVEAASANPPTAPIDLKEIYKVVPESPSSTDAGIWGSIVAEQLADQTHTSIDGTYELTVTGDSFYIYAHYETEYSVIEWFIPVKATDSGEIKIDLQNSNAAFIRNKSDD